MLRQIVVCLALTFCSIGLAQAQVPQRISYQGLLTDGSGVAMNSTVQLILRLYDVMNGGAPLFTETHSVSVASGRFSLQIGSVEPLTLPFDVPYFLGISVAGEDEMVPRQALAAAPYAIRAHSTQSTPAVAGFSNYFRTTGGFGGGCVAATNTTQAKWIGSGGTCGATLLVVTTNGKPMLLNLSLNGYWTAGATSDFKNANVLIQLKTNTGSVVSQEYNQWGNIGLDSTNNPITTALIFSEVVTLPAGTHILELWGRIQNGDANAPKFNMDAGNSVSISAVVLGAP